MKRNTKTEQKDIAENFSRDEGKQKRIINRTNEISWIFCKMDNEDEKISKLWEEQLEDKKNKQVKVSFNQQEKLY